MTRAVATVITLAAAAGLSCRPAPRADESRTPPPSQIAPPAVGLPRDHLTVHDRAAWRPRLDWPQACEDEFQSTRVAEDAGLVFHPMVPGVSLVEVLCAAGAYQPSFVIVRFDERGSQPAATVLSFPTFASPDGRSLEPEEQTELTGDASISKAVQELTVLNLFRQTRDCGVWSRYGIGDPAPQLKEARAQSPCPDNPGPPVTSDAGVPPRGWRTIAPPRAR
jgi:hypothetical protein